MAAHGSKTASGGGGCRAARVEGETNAGHWKKSHDKTRVIRE